MNSGFGPGFLWTLSLTCEERSRRFCGSASFTTTGNTRSDEGWHPTSQCFCLQHTVITLITKISLIFFPSWHLLLRLFHYILEMSSTCPLTRCELCRHNSAVISHELTWTVPGGFIRGLAGNYFRRLPRVQCMSESSLINWKCFFYT